MRIQSKAMLDGAKEQTCVNCWQKDGTVVAAHYCGLNQQEFGKATAAKCHDLLVADLCSQCHSRYDSYRISTVEDPWLRKVDHSQQFLICVARTLVRRAAQGILTTKDIKLGD